MNKKGITPVIASVLLITLVIAMGATIFIFSEGITEKLTGGSITLQGKNIALTCGDIIFEFSYVDGKLYLTNPGNVPISSIKFKVYTDESYKTYDIKDLTSKWPEEGLKIGGAFSDDITFDANTNEVILTPVLMGNTNSGKEKEYVCERESYTLLIN